MADGRRVPPPEPPSLPSHQPPSRPPPPLSRPPAPPPFTCPPPHPPPPRAQLHSSPVKKSEDEHTKSPVEDKQPDKDSSERSSKGGLLLGKRPLGSITMKLKPQSEAKKTKTDTPSEKLLNKPASKTVAAAFGSDSEEEEEMPAEAKLRMRNVGKNTPTSAGPNSFNKSKTGFSDPRGSWRNELND